MQAWRFLTSKQLWPVTAMESRRVVNVSLRSSAWLECLCSMWIITAPRDLLLLCWRGLWYRLEWIVLWLLVSRDISMYGLSQWDVMLHCNVISHWLSPYAEWSLVKGQRDYGRGGRGIDFYNHPSIHIHFRLTLYVLNFSENINIYLHFMSLLHTNKTHVVEIPPRVRQGPAYST